MTQFQTLCKGCSGTLILFSVCTGLLAQTPPAQPPIPQRLINRLPSAYQEEARKLITVMRNVYGEVTDEEWRGIAFGLLAQNPEGAEFLRAQLDKEPSGQIRAQIFAALEQYFTQHPQDQAMVEKHVSSDPDPAAALAALETLRRIRESGLRELLKNRIKAAQDGNENVARQLRDAYLAHYMWYGEVRLPEFAYTPPPLFQVKPAGQFVRVLAFGDFGWGWGGSQIKTAAAMRAYHRKHRFDFGITLGDNFYGRGPFLFAERARGLSGPDDSRWQSQWEQLYGPMGIRFYPSFGNADYMDANSPAAELAYTRKSQSWVFPAPYYTYTAGSVQLFAIDNIRLSDGELQWLDEELAKSKARWKLVYGHYPVYSATDSDNEELISRLLPILKKNFVDVWLNGHNHDLQELEPEGRLHFFVSGGGGAPLSGRLPTYKRSKFTEIQHGFSVIEADDQHLDMIFINEEGKELRRSHLTK